MNSPKKFTHTVLPEDWGVVKMDEKAAEWGRRFEGLKQTSDDPDPSQLWVVEVIFGDISLCDRCAYCISEYEEVVVNNELIFRKAVEHPKYKLSKWMFLCIVTSIREGEEKIRQYMDLARRLQKPALTTK